MKLTAMAPSPTADAQRLTDPLRTSPAAKTPGRLVSRNNGVRPCARQRSPRTASRGTAAPVRTKPFLSSCTQPLRQSVCGSAPMKRNSAGVLIRISPQLHDGLSSRIAGAHDDDLLVATELRFRVRRGIVDAGTLELTQTGHVKAAILNTRRDKDGLAADLRTVGECDDANAGVDPETLHGAGHGDARTEFLRLKQCVEHEFRPGYAQRETEVVLDP